MARWILLALTALLSLAVYSEARDCTAHGIPGTCIPVDQCTGTHTRGLCPHEAANVQCCTPLPSTEPPTESEPTEEPLEHEPVVQATAGPDCHVGTTHGTCIDRELCIRNANLPVSGHCPRADDNVQCCIPPPAVDAEGRQICVIQGTATMGQTPGLCKSKEFCAGEHTTGLCPGLPDDVICCTLEAAPSSVTGIDEFIPALGAAWSALRSDFDQRFNGPAQATEYLFRDMTRTIAGMRMRGSRYSEYELARGWFIGRREQMFFNNRKAIRGDAGFSWAHAGGTPEPESACTGIIGHCNEQRVNRMVLNWIQAAKREFSGFSASTYTGHGEWAADNFLDHYDNLGFYRTEDSYRFLMAVHHACQSVGCDWGTAYNDFNVSDFVNRELGAMHCAFTGHVFGATSPYRGRANWHGPWPLVAHIHVQIHPGTARESRNTAHRAPPNGDTRSVPLPPPTPCSGLGMPGFCALPHSECTTGALLSGPCHGPPLCCVDPARGTHPAPAQIRACVGSRRRPPLTPGHPPRPAAHGLCMTRAECGTASGVETRSTSCRRLAGTVCCSISDAHVVPPPPPHSGSSAASEKQGEAPPAEVPIDDEELAGTDSEESDDPVADLDTEYDEDDDLSILASNAPVDSTDDEEHVVFDTIKEANGKPRLSFSVAFRNRLRKPRQKKQQSSLQQQVHK